jgi:predicted site-specific integrase-resolvase
VPYVRRVPKNPLVPTAEAAKILRVDVRTVHRLVRKGRITPLAKTPGLRGAYLFTVDEIERVAAERTAA